MPHHAGLNKSAYRDMLRGALIYGIGDTIAAVIVGNESMSRWLGITLIGALLYAWEIPLYFRWIEKKSLLFSKTRQQVYKTLMALLYFNPLWITRHVLFILIFSGQWQDIQWSVLSDALHSFLIAIPVTLLANGLIQTQLSLQHRFLASALFSAAMAIYYPLMTL